ncbi:thiamine pyrophosphate-binding protein [Streptomyces sp. NPDC026672]|uniref:thiamine pyrophosphate-binding protein n=1 Tax=unclassified Streptomyces TaxID=2593676 RepID=UPI0033EA2CEC
MTRLTGGGALVAALAAHGVDTVFGIPGTHNLAAYAAMPAHGIRHISARHEQGAGYAADGYARSTGRTGVVITTTGPALLNAAAAAAQAHSDSVPVLLVSPGMPLTHPGLGNGLLHEAKNQTGAMAALVGYSHRVASIAEIPYAVARAFTAMACGRPRPVHLEIPLDLLVAAADVEIVQAAAPPVVTPFAQVLAAAAERIAVGRLPLVIAGGGAGGAPDQVRRFAETLGAPVITTANGKGTLPEDHPLAVGAGVQHPCVHDAVAESDCVIAIGTELAPADWWTGLPGFGTELIRIDIDAGTVNTNAVASHALVGDTAATLDALLELLTFDTPPDAEDRATRLRRRHRADAAREGAPWLDITEALRSALPRDAIVAGDSAMACYYGALSNLPLHRPRAFLYPTGFGTLGYGLPAGIGAKVAAPDTPVLVLQGDGGTMFTVAELAVGAELGLALPVLVVDNGGYGEIRDEMADRGEPVHAVTFPGPDFPALARSLGCHGRHIGTVADLGPAITEAFDADRPTVLHVHEDSRSSSRM